MRCWQAKQKLKSIQFDNSEIAQDQMLLDHLNECSACASLVTAERSLRSDFQSAAIDDNEEVVSNWLLKAQVERQAADANRSQFRENHFMAIFTNLIKKQSKLTIGVTTVAVVLLLSVLIPFSYDKTIGYEVAFAGVDKNLAMDSDKLHVLLEKLGIDGAVIDVSGCEATCNVTITDLKSPDDAKLVKAAFNEIDHVVLLQDIKEVFETKEGNILKRISLHTATGDGTHDFEFYGDADSDAMHNVVVDLLGDDLHETFKVWVSKDGDCDTLNFNPSQNAFFISDGNGTSSMDVKTDINKDGEVVITVNSGTPEEETITIPAGEDFNDETLQLLKDLGLDVHMLDGNVGNLHEVKLHKIIELKTDGDLQETEETDNDALEKTVGDIPEGFELSQNYPNPFNPTTTIDFTIPNSGHVSIEIINVRGQIVKTLIDQQMGAGAHTIEWDATNAAGAKVASGVYLYRLTTPENSIVKKMTLMK